MRGMTDSERLFERCIDLGADGATVAAWPDPKRRAFIDEHEEQVMATRPLTPNEQARVNDHVRRWNQQVNASGYGPAKGDELVIGPEAPMAQTDLERYAELFEERPELAPQALKFGRFTYYDRSKFPCDHAGWYMGDRNDATVVPDDTALALCRSSCMAYIADRPTALELTTSHGWVCFDGRLHLRDKPVQSFTGHGSTLDVAMIALVRSLKSAEGGR